MKLFIDTAHLADIETALRMGVVRGITTNPSLFAKEPKGAYLLHVKKIIALAKKYGKGYSVSIEVFSADPKEMIAQAKRFVRTLRYPHLAIKIPISYQGQQYLEVVHELSRSGITVNCTACMTPMQAIAAAAAGARYVSLFYTRIRNGGTDAHFNKERVQVLAEHRLEEGDFDPDRVIHETRALLASYPDTEIIIGSIRNPVDVKRSGVSGAHIVTVPPQVLQAFFPHYKTDEVVSAFLKDFADWNT